MPILHIMHGFVGAGKTTFSKKLQSETKAVRFTPDEWILALYGEPVENFADCNDRVYMLIYKMAAATLAAGADVILDFGFWIRTERDKARAFAKDNGAEYKLYHLQCPEDVMRQRTLARTAAMPEGALRIDENAIDEFKKIFEPLGADEKAIVIATR